MTTLIKQTTLVFPFRIRKYYSQQIQHEIEKEAQPDFDFDSILFRKSHFHETILNIIATFGIDYDVEDSGSGTLFKRKLRMNSNHAFEIFTHKNINRIFTFWALATYGYHSISNLSECKLYFNNNLELRDLSDGEYQLLSIYSLIDLFDKKKTIFLLDEIDSHVHYTNLKKIWAILDSELKGRVITTTHISESILQNKFENIRVVKRGKIESELTLRELAKRVTTIVGKKKYEYQLASKVENIVLIDHEDDWYIFKKLAEKKINQNTVEVFSKLIPFQKTSSFNNTNEIFGLGKLLFVKEFKSRFDGEPINTKNIFMICDKDKLHKNSVKADLQVNFHKDYKYLKKFNNVKSHLLSWKRLEIENYVLSVTMLDKFDKLEELKNTFQHIELKKNHNLDNFADIEEFDAKKLVHPLYKTNGFDRDLLDKLISLIPKEEISEDIVTMYNYLKNNIAN